MNRNLLPALATALVWVFLATRATAQVAVSGDQTVGARITDQNNTSSRFNEYRDIRDGTFLQSLRVGLLDAGTGRYLVFSGVNLIRDDQTASVDIGDWRRDVRARLTRTGIPHRFSNSAMTPYIYRGDGLYTVPATAGILKDGDDGTGTPSLVPTTAQMGVNDELIADYVQRTVHPVSLGIQRDRTELELNLAPSADLALGLSVSDERRSGDRLGYGTIGDRPPRTMSAQLPEPVDFATREVDASVALNGGKFQTQLTYTLSVFRNDVEAIRWQNLYFNPDPGLDYITSVAGTARNVSAFGQRALAPDNVSHSLVFAGGMALPRNSRLNVTAAVGLMNQDGTLLPYSWSVLGTDQGALTGDGLAWNSTSKLPRRTAEAKMRTLRLGIEYAISPVRRLNLRAFANYESLDNQTPIDEWKYATQDVVGTNGDVNYRSYRRNLPYAYDRLQLGVEARRSFARWRTTARLQLKRRSINREYREADTDENSVEGTLRTSPARWLTLRGSVLVADRQGDGYDYRVTSQSYWYSVAQGDADVDNPAFLFANHPDLRKFDVSDRSRLQANLSATVVTRSNVDVTLRYAYRSDDFESGVDAVQPLVGTVVALPDPADEFASTPGEQLGLLEQMSQEGGAELNYSVSERTSLMVMVGLEKGNYRHSGMVFNENQRRQPSHPSIQVPTQLGPWTDPDRIYHADVEQKTTSLGAGVRHELVPGRLRVLADFLWSRTDENIIYSGYGSDPAYLGVAWETFQFGFDDPPSVLIDYKVATATIEYGPSDRTTLALHYMLDRFEIKDWQLDAESDVVENVGSPWYVRDVTRDNRWGNRLVSMGGEELAPGYTFHGVGLTLRYRF